MNCNSFNDNLLARSALLVHIYFFHSIKRGPSFYYPSKNSVLSIQVGGLVEGDEELTTVRVRAFVGHGQDTTGIVLE